MHAGGEEEGEQKVHIIETAARDPEAELENRANFRKQYDILET